MTTVRKRWGVALLSGVSLAAMSVGAAVADPMPPEQSLSSLEYELLPRDALWT